MDPPVLKYNPQLNVFFITTGNDYTPAKIFGATLVHTQQGKVWTFPAWYPSGCISLRDFKSLYPDGKATKDAIDKILKLKEVGDTTNLIDETGYQFKIPPYEHQLRTIEVMLHSKYLALLLEMGLGKTFISINYLQIKKNMSGEFPALVVAPKRMLDNWGYEIQDYTDLSYIVYSGTKRQKEKLRAKYSAEKPDVFITNYEALVPEQKFFKDQKFKCIIIDEASRIKSYTSQRSSAILNIGASIPFRFILSGTISLGNPLDVFTPYSFLDTSILGSNFYRFRAKHCRFSPWNKHIIIGYKNLDVLKAKIEPFSIIINKDDCLSLPERTFGKRWYTPTEKMISLYNKVVKEDIVIIGDKHIRTHTPLLKINKMRQVLSGFIITSPERNEELCGNCPKIIECIDEDTYPWDKECTNPLKSTVKKPKREYIFLDDAPKLEMLKEDLLSTNQRVCVWVNYQQDIANIREMLDKEGVSYVVFDRPGMDKVFKEGNQQVFLGQVSTGIGITITEATYTIYYSHSLRLEDRLQSVDRNYRIGQKSKVHVTDYVCRGSLEESVIELLEKKEDVRNYIHSSMKALCAACEKQEWCKERMIMPFSKKCKYNNVKRNVEEVKHLLIHPMYIEEMEEDEDDNENCQ